MACMMCIVAGLMVSLFDPNGPINRKYTFLRVILRVQEGPGYAKRTNNGAARATFGSLWGQFGVSFVVCG